MAIDLITYAAAKKAAKNYTDKKFSLEIGRFLSTWDATTGLPATDPATMPYTYETGDYYIVDKTGATNYKPSGTSYSGTASTATESDSIEVSDVYYYDGATWLLLTTSDSRLGQKMDKIDPTGQGNLQVNGVARGEKSVAIGDKVTAYGDNSVAEGVSDHLASEEVTDQEIDAVVAASNASNRSSQQQETIGSFIDTWDHLDGNGDADQKFALAGGLFSKAEGANGLALAKGSHAEGNGTVAAGKASHAEGTGSKALNHYSHAGGLESIASGKRAFTHGYRTRAIHSDQFVVGAYNEDDYDGLFIVGNGSEGQNGDPDVRQNAFVVTRDGKAEIGADVEDNDNEKTLIDLKYLKEYFPTKDILDTSEKVDAVKEAGLYRVAFDYSLTGTGDVAYGEMLSIPYKSTDNNGKYFGAQLFFANGDYNDGKQNCLWYRTINGTTWNNWVKIDPANLQAKLVSGTNIKTVGNQSLLGSGNVSFKTINNENIVGNGNIEIQGCPEEIETLAAFCGDGGLYNNNGDDCKVITEAHEKFVIEGKAGASGDLILTYKDFSSDELAVGVGSDGFMDNVHITSVLMPDTMKYIRSYAFKGNTNLESIHLSKNLLWIENNAFENCVSLTSVELPKFLYSLGYEAFKGCINLTEMVIPSSVISIGTDAFDGCPNLTVYCEAGSDIATYCEDNSINYVTTYGANLPDKHEVIANKVTSISNASTDTQYPSAKCVYDALKTKQTIVYKNTLDQVLVPNAQYDLGTSDQATLTLTLPVPKGTKTVSELNDNALEKTTGDVYILSDSGTLTAGSLAVVAGDWVEWNGTAWKKIDSYSCKEIYVAFKSGSTATSLTIVGNYEGDTSYLPSTDCICELSFKYICGSWVLVTKETALSA